MDAKVTWKGKLAFVGTADSGFEVPLDTKAAVGGDESGFQPMEMFAVGLAACTAMDVIAILGKKQQEVADFEVKVHVDRAREHPKVFTQAVIEYVVTGRMLEEEAVVRAIELSVTRYCPAHAMFSQLFPITLKYHIYEPQEEGARLLVASGEYVVPEEQITQ